MASVSDDTLVGPRAEVGGQAIINNKCKIVDNARVYGNAYIADSVVLEDNVQVFGTAEVKNGLVIFGDARVSVPPKVILGFDHPVIITDEHVFLGCHCFDMEQWKKAPPIIKVNGYPTKTAYNIHRIVTDIADVHFSLFIKEKDEIHSH
jgi:carbonic anhydrase/acetyltransferase-like protein (isoleucine patch superfamily)